jgi:hypothetical protein
MVDKKTDSYLFQKRGIWYFSKHVPVDVRGHYPQPRIVRSLRTRLHSKASRTATVWCEQLESVWAGIRVRHFGIGPSLEQITRQPVGGPKLSSALAMYLKLKGDGKSELYELAFPIWNACGQFIDENLVVQPCFRTQSRVQGGVRAC